MGIKLIDEGGIICQPECGIRMFSPLYSVADFRKENRFFLFKKLSKRII